jgi:cytochrome c-type biogenesis protein CcmE
MARLGTVALLLVACTPKAPADRRSARDDVVTHHELDALPSELTTPLIRIHGTVVPGSVKMRRGGPELELAFDLSKGSVQLAVTHIGLPPDTFRDGADVVVQGVLAPDRASFVSLQMIVRPAEWPK